MLFCPSCQNINLLWRFSLEYPGADENRIKTTQVQLSFIEQLKCRCSWIKSSGVPFICEVCDMITSEALPEAVKYYVGGVPPPITPL